MASILSRRSLDLFEAKLDRDSSPNGCWLWTGSSWNGYGRLTRTVDGRSASFQAHRFAYMAYVGPIPEGRHVLHVCDQPGCCNPSHLFLGNHAENMQDMISKGRGNYAAGERNGRAVLSRADVTKIRALARSGMEQKQIAVKFQVTPTTISRVVLRKNWRHVP